MPNNSFRTPLLLVRRKSFFLCLELGYYSSKILILTMFLSAKRSIHSRKSVFFLKKKDCGNGL